MMSMVLISIILFILYSNNIERLDQWLVDEKYKRIREQLKNSKLKYKD